MIYSRHSEMQGNAHTFRKPEDFGLTKAKISLRYRVIDDKFAPSKVRCNQKLRWHGDHGVTDIAICTLSFQLYIVKKATQFDHPNWKVTQRTDHM